MGGGKGGEVRLGSLAVAPRVVVAERARLVRVVPNACSFQHPSNNHLYREQRRVYGCTRAIPSWERCTMAVSVSLQNGRRAAVWRNETRGSACARPRSTTNVFFPSFLPSFLPFSLSLSLSLFFLFRIDRYRRLMLYYFHSGGQSVRAFSSSSASPSPPGKKMGIHADRCMAFW